jgi:hypothetical protein
LPEELGAQRRQASADEAAWPASGARDGVRDAGRSPL